MYDRTLNSKVAKATVEKRIPSFSSTVFLGLFIAMSWLVPDTINIIGTRTSPSSSLLSGLNPRSIFYPVFAFVGLKYIADCLLMGQIRSKHASGSVYFFTVMYVTVTGLVFLGLGEGYTASRFIFVIPFMLTYTFGIFAAGQTGRGSCYRTLSQIIVLAGLCLAGILIVESFILQGSIYELLMGHNPTLRDQAFDRRQFGSLWLYRASGPFMNPLRAGFALLFPLALILSKIGVYSARKDLLRLFFLCFVGIGVWATGSLGAIIPAGIMVITYCLLYLGSVKGKIFSKVLVLCIFGLACLIMFFSALGSLWEEIFALLSGDQASSRLSSLGIRYEAVMMAFQYWLDLPLSKQLVGKGIGWLQYDKLSFLSEVRANDIGLYMAMLLEIGFLGMIGLVLFFAMWFASAINNAKGSHTLEQKAFYFSFATYVIGLLFSFFSFNYYNMLYVVAIAYLIFDLRTTTASLSEETKDVIIAHGYA